MKPFLVLLFSLTIILQCVGQAVDIMPKAAVEKDTSGIQKSKPFGGFHQIKKPEYHVSAGMDFFTASGYGSGFTEYVTPSVSYALGKRFILSGGISVANTNYFNARPLYSGDIFEPYSGNYTSITVFAAGTYFVSDRLTISGAFYKEIPLAGRSIAYAPYSYNAGQGSQGFNVNAQYKLGKHVFIQAGFEMNQGRDPYNLNPFAPAHNHGIEGLNWGGLPQTMYNIFSPQP
ncbi:MAG: hypothetical protein NTX43_01740 [Bacteroidetes bacterium]|nr:hypothetical protein [Bacteroidota bacterium]